jgi:hypothetical protein
MDEFEMDAALLFCTEVRSENEREGAREAVTRFGDLLRANLEASLGWLEDQVLLIADRVCAGGNSVADFQALPTQPGASGWPGCPAVSVSRRSSSSRRVYRVTTISPSGLGMRACMVPNPPSPTITSGWRSRNLASRTTGQARPGPGAARCVSSSRLPPARAGDLVSPVPVDREQHRAEHRAVVPVEPVAEGGH